MIDVETISKIPEKKATIGVREIIKGINSGKIKEVIVASNCPEKLYASMGVVVKKFEGDEKDLATKLGKPFPVAMAGFE